MTEMELYQTWLDLANDDPDLHQELKSIAGDTEAINDRFYRDLEFGTGGLLYDFHLLCKLVCGNQIP